MAAATGLRRLLIDYDSTLSPGQGNAPLTPERAALLERYLRRWRQSGVQLYILTSSNPEKKVEALQAAGIADLFDKVLSSSFPHKFASKGEFIAKRISENQWRPTEQLLADDSIEAIQSIWQDTDGNPWAAGALAHTLRLPQHSADGLVEADLSLIDEMVHREASASTSHCFCLAHAGARVVDTNDSPEKCMLDTLSSEARGQVLSANPPERCGVWTLGRPDLAELCKSATVAEVATVPSAGIEETESAAAKAPVAKGKGKAPLPPPGKGAGKSQAAPATPAAAAAPAAADASGSAEGSAPQATPKAKGKLPPPGKAKGKGKGPEAPPSVATADEEKKSDSPAASVETDVPKGPPKGKGKSPPPPPGKGKGQASSEESAPSPTPTETKGILPDGWEAFKDDKGKDYYHNASTNETRWEYPAPMPAPRPEGEGQAVAAAGVQAADAAAESAANSTPPETKEAQAETQDAPTSPVKGKGKGPPPPGKGKSKAPPPTQEVTPEPKTEAPPPTDEAPPKPTTEAAPVEAPVDKPPADAPTEAPQSPMKGKGKAPPPPGKGKGKSPSTEEAAPAHEAEAASVEATVNEPLTSAPTDAPKSPSKGKGKAPPPPGKGPGKGKMQPTEESTPAPAAEAASVEVQEAPPSPAKGKKGKAPSPSKGKGKGKVDSEETSPPSAATPEVKEAEGSLEETGAQLKDAFERGIRDASLQKELAVGKLDQATAESIYDTPPKVAAPEMKAMPPPAENSVEPPSTQAKHSVQTVSIATPPGSEAGSFERSPSAASEEASPMGQSLSMGGLLAVSAFAGKMKKHEQLRKEEVRLLTVTMHSTAEVSLETSSGRSRAATEGFFSDVPSKATDDFGFGISSPALEWNPVTGFGLEPPKRDELQPFSDAGGFGLHSPKRDPLHDLCTAVECLEAALARFTSVCPQGISLPPVAPASASGPDARPLANLAAALAHIEGTTSQLLAV